MAESDHGSLSKGLIIKDKSSPGNQIVTLMVFWAESAEEPPT